MTILTRGKGVRDAEKGGKRGHREIALSREAAVRGTARGRFWKIPLEFPLILYHFGLKQRTRGEKGGGVGISRYDRGEPRRGR